MSLENKNIILINFDFPPNFGIGGRRWGKIAKDFASRGFNVYVIKSEPLDGQISHWTADVQSSSIRTFSIPRKAQLTRFSVGNSVLDSITYKLAIKLNEWKEKGTPFDLAIGWKAEFNRLLKQLLSETQAEWVFCTGAPFNLCYYAAEYLRENGGFKLWIDLRDPWLKAKNYGMPNLSKKRYNQEIDKAKSVLSNADIVSSPSDVLLDELRDLDHGKWNTKLYELKHFFDLDDCPAFPQRPNDDTLRIVYGGEIYQEGEYFLEKMAADLDDLKQNNSELYSRLEFSFFTVSPHKITQIFARHSIVKSANSIGDKIFSEIAKSDFCIIFLAEHNRNFFTTKYFEYLPLQKPYLFIGPEGKVSEEIEANKMGCSWQSFIDRLKQEKLDYTDFGIASEQLENNSLSARVDEIIGLTNLK